MKKLVLIDHEGNRQLVLDLFLEGEDLIYSSTTPVAYWLGTLSIMSVEDYQKMLTEEAERQGGGIIPPDREVESLEEARTDEQALIEDKINGVPLFDVKSLISVICSKCLWMGQLAECGFGHDDYYCPSCGKESIVEVQDADIKEAINPSVRGTRTGEANEPQGAPAAPEKPAKRKTASRSKRVRNRKATEDTLGGRT